jgi:hypothetical protein
LVRTAIAIPGASKEKGNNLGFDLMAVENFTVATQVEIGEIRVRRYYLPSANPGS